MIVGRTLNRFPNLLIDCTDCLTEYLTANKKIWMTIVTTYNTHYVKFSKVIAELRTHPVVL